MSSPDILISFNDHTLSSTQYVITEDGTPAYVHHWDKK